MRKAMVYALCEGRKTVERRPYKRGKAPGLTIGKCLPVVIADTPPPQPRVATVRVKFFERERLRDSETDAACRAEGFGGLDPVQLRRDYWNRHLNGYDPELEVWRVDLELVSTESKVPA